MEYPTLCGRKKDRRYVAVTRLLGRGISACPRRSGSPSSWDDAVIGLIKEIGFDGVGCRQRSADLRCTQATARKNRYERVGQDRNHFNWPAPPPTGLRAWPGLESKPFLFYALPSTAID